MMKSYSSARCIVGDYDGGVQLGSQGLDDAGAESRFGVQCFAGPIVRDGKVPVFGVRLQFHDDLAALAR